MQTYLTLNPFDGQVILELEQDGTGCHAKIYLSPEQVVVLCTDLLHALVALVG